MLMIPHTCREYFIGTYQDCFQIFIKAQRWSWKKQGCDILTVGLIFRLMLSLIVLMLMLSFEGITHGPENSLALNSCLANKQNKFLELLPK